MAPFPQTRHSVPARRRLARTSVPLFRLSPTPSSKNRSYGQIRRFKRYCLNASLGTCRKRHRVLSGFRRCATGFAALSPAGAGVGDGRLPRPASLPVMTLADPSPIGWVASLPHADRSGRFYPMNKWGVKRGRVVLNGGSLRSRFADYSPSAPLGNGAS